MPALEVPDLVVVTMPTIATASLAAAEFRTAVLLVALLPVPRISGSPFAARAGDPAMAA
jgi:hypothetical protein